MKISVSVTDSPVLRSLENQFAGIKKIGADGVEITPGVKSRWSFKKVKELADKYGLSITAIHQPLWSIIGIWFDEGFIKEGVKIGVKNFVFHPPSKLLFGDKRMTKFFKKLSELQVKYGVNLLLENMAWAVRPKLLRKYLPYPLETCDPQQVYEAVKGFGLGVTLDTSHAFTPKPHLQAWFSNIFPAIKNIHLSSFAKGRDHLPLDIGDLDTTGLIKELRRRNYQGLITLEIFYPNKVSMKSYDFDAIKRSIELIRK